MYVSQMLCKRRNAETLLKMLQTLKMMQCDVLCKDKITLLHIHICIAEDAGLSLS